MISRSRFLLSVGIASLLMVLTAGVLWVWSYPGVIANPVLAAPSAANPTMAPAACWRVLNWRGQLILLHCGFVPASASSVISCDLRSGKSSILLLGKELVIAPSVAPGPAGPGGPPRVVSRPYSSMVVTDGARPGNLFGFGVAALPRPDASRNLFLNVQAVAVPWWFIVLMMGIFVVRCYRMWRKSGRPVAGRCTSCGYDLRATPERCPECGVVPALHSIASG